MSWIRSRERQSKHLYLIVFEQLLVEFERA